MAHNFNIEIKTTPAYSPWSNGILERHNKTLTEIMIKIKNDTECDWECALSWALMAKNSMCNSDGFSPYQLVFGRNPNLPSVYNDKPPALEGITNSEMIGAHIMAMYTARKAFAEAECSTKYEKQFDHKLDQQETSSILVKRCTTKSLIPHNGVVLAQ